ncbi:MAG: ATP-binding protein [Promethearchaeota archaeon]
MIDLGNKIGSFVSGSFVKLILRQKSDKEFELGQLFVTGNNINDYSIFQIKDLYFGSQIPDNSLELMAGYGLERETSSLKIYEPELRNYVLAVARELISVKKNLSLNKYELSIPKKLPRFFSDIYNLEDSHLKFFHEEQLETPLNLGKVRSGSKIINVDVKVDALEVLKHHILIPAATGRGKSNLVKTILYDLMDNDKCGKLVFDPHNEYYGSLNQKGLRDHPESTVFLEYYTIRDIAGHRDLRFNMRLINPGHVLGSLSFTDAQTQALIAFHRLYGDNWTQAIFSDDRESFPAPEGVDIDRTLPVIRRKMGLLLHIFLDDDGNIVEKGIYTLDGHKQITHEIINSLSEGKTVIIDTSLFEGAEEIFIASIIVESIFNEYRRRKFQDLLHNEPVISIVIEEAPRMIGKKVLESIDNVFGKIAREGRKFQIGLIAITQLPSIIDREILANMNTKIILGNEMGPERRALIDSAAQDLSDDYQTIGSLDKGEAIVTSTFTKFAVPISIPLFEDFINEYDKKYPSSPKPKRRSPGL